MEYTYTVTYLKCQSCSAKSHCDQCSREVLAQLLGCPGVEDAFLDLGQKLARVSGSDEDRLLDALDDVGLFTD